MLKIYIDFNEVGNDWAMSAQFPPVEGDGPEYVAAARSMVEYLNGLVERDTGRSGAVALRVEEG